MKITSCFCSCKSCGKFAASKQSGNNVKASVCSFAGANDYICCRKNGMCWWQFWHCKVDFVSGKPLFSFLFRATSKIKLWLQIAVTATAKSMFASANAVHFCCNKCLQSRSELRYNFIAKCQYSCTRNVLWCQTQSSHIHANHKTLLNYNNSKQTSR